MPVSFFIGLISIIHSWATFPFLPLYKIGKKSFKDEHLIKNYNAILETLEKEKSNNTLKGDLIKSAFITSSMGVSYLSLIHI